MTKEDIVEYCKYYDIQKYTINDDMTVDVDGDVNLQNCSLVSLPLVFGKITGSFYCFNSLLTSLKGSPKYVGGSFYCNNNKLTSLQWCPDHVCYDFFCGYNKLSILEFCPRHINGLFDCTYNKLTTLKYIPMHIGESFFCNNNELTSLQDLPIDFYIGLDFNCGKNNIKEAKEYSKLLFGTVSGYITTGFPAVGKFLNTNKNPPKKDLPRLLSELRKIQI